MTEILIITTHHTYLPYTARKGNLLKETDVEESGSWEPERPMDV